jgi:hypothetical protein
MSIYHKSKVSYGIRLVIIKHVVVKELLILQVPISRVLEVQMHWDNVLELLWFKSVQILMLSVLFRQEDKDCH